jgi:hypothetical protein
MFDFASTVSGLFKSDAEKEVDALYGGGQDYSTIPEVNLRYETFEGRPINVPLSVSATPSYLEQAQTGLADLWARTELLISPESEAEHIVNQIYGYDDNGIPLMPPNFAPAIPDMPSVPHFIAAPITAVKNAITTAGDTVKDFFVKYAIIAIVVLIAGVFVYAFVGAKARKLA